MKLVKVEGHGSLVKDLESGAVLNSSAEEFANFKSKRNKEKMYQKKIETLEQRIARLEELLMRSHNVN